MSSLKIYVAIDCQQTYATATHLSQSPSNYKYIITKYIVIET